MILPHEHLQRALLKAYRAAFPEGPQIDFEIEPASDPRHGDFVCTAAMKIAPQISQAPREVAQFILAKLGPMPMLERAEVAGPGFLNFFLKPAWLMRQVDAIADDSHYGQSNQGKGQKVLVEYLSANPTGPLTLHNGRGAFAGDTMANVLVKNGWRVQREYYLNDVGNQVNILAESVIRKYYQRQGIPTEYPDYCYQGAYVEELASKLKIDRMKLGDMLTLRDRIKGRVLEVMIKELQRVVVQKLGIQFDRWQRESDLYQSKLDLRVVTELQRHDLIYDRDGAQWFRTTAFGDDKDRVLRKRDGEATYFLSDLALRWYRFAYRRIDRELLYLGADHHGYVGRLQAGMSALGFARKLDVAIVQLVKLVRDGQEVRMSKRAGTYVPIEDVVDEVGLDVARFFFLMHAADTHMDFDLTAAKEKSEANPVFYVQYAHARIASIIRKARSLTIVPTKEPPQPVETMLAKSLFEYPNLLRSVGETYETHRLPFYAISLARAFHEFYTQCRVIDGTKVLAPRMRLLRATQRVLADVLGVMGVQAPERM